MADTTEFSLIKICCTCLSENRKLIQLCKVKDAVNELFMLLSSDSDAYEELFYKDSTSLAMCWECHAVMRKIRGFRRQAGVAQRQLTAIADGRAQIKSFSCLSHLSIYHKSNVDRSYILSKEHTAALANNSNTCENNDDTSISPKNLSKSLDNNDISNDHLDNYKDNQSCSTNNIVSTSDNYFNYENNHKIIPSGHDSFVDCGVTEYVNIKLEVDEEDIPISQLTENFGDNYICVLNSKSKYKTENSQNRLKKNSKTTEQSRKSDKKTKLANKKGDSNAKEKEYYKTTNLSQEDMISSRKNRKLAVIYMDAVFKCESCIEGFKEQSCLDSHNAVLHTEKPDHILCDICLCYIPSIEQKEHRNMHFTQHTCNFCDYVAYNLTDMLKHLKLGHSIKNLAAPRWKKGLRKTPKVKNPGSRPRMNAAMRDKRTPFGYQCPDCPKYFETKRQRWKHVMKEHKEGFRCSFCGKRFAFKFNLIKHERNHTTPLPREECEVCHKLIRLDLVKSHARIHVKRDSQTCVVCQKTFANRQSYVQHLKYSQAHAPLEDILKYKCPQCDKGYRSQGELRDHVNYQHNEQTIHKCPICEKALATLRCVKRHVKRAHEGIKESPKDKICQQCGKAFRDKKGLREHELTHTGERPLSCPECGNTFRQYASLYTHRKRVHKIYAAKKQVKGIEAGTGQMVSGTS